MVGRGGVAPFDGDLDDYQKYLLDHAKKMREDAKKASAAPAPVTQVAIEKEALQTHKQGSTGTSDTQINQKSRQKNAAKPLRKEIDKIDSNIQALNLEKDTLQIQLAQINVSNAPTELAQIGKRLKAIDVEIGTLEERWLELTEQIETAAV